jgi:hypothetical protein
MRCTAVGRRERQNPRDARPVPWRSAVSARVRLAIDLADSRRESPAEAVAAVRFYEHGITGLGAAGLVPGRQVCTGPSASTSVTRRARLIVEIDGLGKLYLGSGVPRVELEAGAPARAVAARSQGWQVIRISWKELFEEAKFEEIRPRRSAVRSTPPPDPRHGLLCPQCIANRRHIVHRCCRTLSFASGIWAQRARCGEFHPAPWLAIPTGARPPLTRSDSSEWRTGASCVQRCSMWRTGGTAATGAKRRRRCGMVQSQRNEAFARSSKGRRRTEAGPERSMMITQDPASAERFRPASGGVEENSGRASEFRSRGLRLRLRSAGTPCVPRSGRRHRAALRCAAAGCTSRRVRSVPVHRP